MAEPSGYAQIISLQVAFLELKVTKIKIFLIFHFFEVHAEHEFSTILSCIDLIFFPDQAYTSGYWIF